MSRAEMCVQDDGTILTIEHPSRFILDHPTYGQWLKFLLTRDAAVTYTEGERTVIKVRDKQYAHNLDGEVRLRCLACGLLGSEIDMSKITIGGLVRMPEEEQEDVNHVTVRTVLRPVSKTGFGCPACADKFQACVRATAQENELREALGVASAKLEAIVARVQAEGQEMERCPRHPSMGRFCVCLKRPKPTAKVKGTSKLTPWIDVFDVSNGFTMEPKEDK